MNDTQRYPKRPNKNRLPNLCENCMEIYAAFKERKLFCDEDAVKLKDYIGKKYGMRGYDASERQI